MPKYMFRFAGTQLAENDVQASLNLFGGEHVFDLPVVVDYPKPPTEEQLKQTIKLVIGLPILVQGTAIGPVPEGGYDATFICLAANDELTAEVGSEMEAEKKGKKDCTN